MQVILDHGFRGLDVPPSPELQIHSDALLSASFSCPVFFPSALLDSTNLITDHQGDSKGGEVPQPEVRCIEIHLTPQIWWPGGRPAPCLLPPWKDPRGCHVYVRWGFPQSRARAFKELISLAN